MTPITHRNADFHCAHCGIGFARRYRYGRKPLYCSRTCRQRAYEARRRAAFHPAFPAPVLPPPLPASYEAGLRGFSLRHALRPEAFPGPGDLRPTLCGTRARPINKPFRGPTRTPICLTCARIERAYPPQRAHDASFDSAVLVTMVGKLRHRAHDDDIAPLLDYCFPCPDTTRLQLPRHTLAATGTTGPTGLAIDP